MQHPLYNVMRLSNKLSSSDPEVGAKHLQSVSPTVMCVQSAAQLQCSELSAERSEDCIHWARRQLLAASEDGSELQCFGADTSHVEIGLHR